jgi:hypothetical protein
MAGVMSLARSSYVAAAAPNSGGVIQDVPLEDPSHVPAVMTMHGGSGDTVIVNFADMSHTCSGLFWGRAGSWSSAITTWGIVALRPSLHERAWDFMKAHPFGTEPSPYEAGLPADFPSYCVIPVTQDRPRLVSSARSFS